MCSARVNNTHRPKDGTLLQCRSRGDPRKPRCVSLSLALQQRLRGTSQKYIWLVYTHRRDGYSQNSLRPCRNCVRRLPRGQSGEKRHTTFIFTRWHGRRNYRTLVNGGCGKGLGEEGIVDLPKNALGSLSPNYPYLTLLDKRRSGMLVASGATVVVAISIVHNGRRFASSFGFGSTLGAAVNVNPAFVDTRTAVAYAYKQLGIS